MAYRVTDDEVKEIIKTTIDNLTPFIAAANALINDALSDEISDGDVSATQLEQIELWLAAHFLAIRDPRVMEKRIGETSARFHGKSGMFLESTPYGQQAVLLDPTGRLAERGKGQKRASVKAIDFSTASDS